MTTVRQQFDSSAALASLRRRWWIIAATYMVALLLGYYWLRQTWAPAYAQHWAILSGCTFAFALWVLLRGLADNYRREDKKLLPTLGAGNLLTVSRGVAIGFLAGFLFLPRPEGFLAWAPALLYTVVIAGDYLDGYLARITDHDTPLGETLDMEFDVLGMLFAVLVAVQYGQLPLWYVIVGLGRYLFLAGIWWRERLGLPVYDIRPSANRRMIAGIQMGFLAVVLTPVLSPPVTTLAAILFIIPLLIGFGRDWLVVSGRADFASATQRRVRRQLLTIVTQWLPIPLRVIVAITAMLLLRPVSEQLITLVHVRPLSVEPLTIALASLGLISILLLLLGIAGRLAALLLLIVVCADILSNGFDLGRGFLLASTIVVLHVGTGAYSLWQPEEVIFTRRPSEKHNP